jgi:hypothetical protein
MNAQNRLSTVLVLLIMAMILNVPIVVSAPTISLPGNVTASQTYIDVLTYYYQCCFAKDWQTQMAGALNAPPLVDKQKNVKGKMVATSSTDPQSTHVVLAGVPANAWWIDAWRLELNGTWTKILGHSFKPASKAPGPVDGDLTLQGTLPTPYVIRVCDRAGGVLAGSPKLLVIRWAGGEAQKFDVSALPVASPDQLAAIKM